MAFSLRARVIFPLVLPPMEDGVVAVEGERIASVGQTRTGEVTDLGDVALLPGFVNAHTHLEFSHLRQPLGQSRMRLVDWIRLVIGERGRRVDACLGAVDEGVRESATYGVTTVGDIATGELSADVPAGVVLTSFAEVIGFSRARAESALAAVETRLKQPRPASAMLGISPHAPYTVSPVLLERLVGLVEKL